ncbi:MAG: AAA family ATPase [Prevotella sp.]|nr:AAA family ATPase [Prevotella sp.]
MEQNIFFQPHKEWQTTNGGYPIVPFEQLNIKTRPDESGQLPNIVRCTCPDCADYKEHGNDPCVRLNLKSGYGRCYKCGFTFVADKCYKRFESKQPVKPQKKAYRFPDVSKVGPLSAVAIDFLLKRCISSATAQKAGVGSAKHFFSKIRLERDSLAFPYKEGNRVVNIQYRTTDKLLEVESGCELIPWNIDACIGQESVFITEGQMDALALMECGIDNVISVPNGAQSELNCFNRFMKSHFSTIKTVYIAGDLDEEGLKLRYKLAGYFGEARCQLVDWRIDDDEVKSAKDANEMLIKYGRETVLKCIASAYPCPINGVQTIGDFREKVLDIWEHGVKPGKTVGWGEFDEHVQWEPGRMLIVVGEPGTGKSTFIDDLILNLAIQHQWKAAFYSPEMFPMERHIYRLATTITGCKFREYKVETEKGIDRHIPVVTRETAEGVINWMDENLFFITETGGRTIDKILHQAEQLQLRYGIKVVLIDPFSYIQLPDTAKSDTMKIGDILAEIELFAHRTGLFVIVIAHPTKPQKDLHGKKNQSVTSLYDISGSAEFYNRTDYGLVLVNADPDPKDKYVQGNPNLHILKVIFNKVRDDNMGHKGECYLSFDPETYRHGAVERIWQAGKDGKTFPILNVLDISNDCWLDL